MLCPICGKEAKTTTGLRRHMTGTRPYGGHELTAEEAAWAAAGASAGLHSSAADADEFLAKALAGLAANKKLPKYEFERVVDAFLGVFLPDIVSCALRLRGKVELVAQEFPLKKREGNLSTNVDYVLHTAAKASRPWVFLELKTDSASHNRKQARIYAERLAGVDMRDLFVDVKKLADATSKASQKYAALVQRFMPFDPVRGPIRVVYLTPKPVSADSLLPKSSPAELVESFAEILTSITFTDLLDADIGSYPHAWSLFRKEVLAECAAW